VSLARLCSRNGCSLPAVATLTYVYRDQTAVVGPLATFAEPHTYDLCPSHAERLTVPRGWDVVRLAGDYTPAPPSDDDLLALANAVREAGRPRPAAEPFAAPRAVARAAAPEGAEQAQVPARPGRGHLRVVASTD
jgi:hypothetical protein